MKLKLFAMIALFLSSAAHADEGMWLLGNLNKQTQKSIKELGLQSLPIITAVSVAYNNILRLNTII